MHRTPHPYLRGELTVVIDCADLGRAAEFWTAVLGYVPEGLALGRRYLGLIPAAGRVGRSCCSGYRIRSGTRTACTSTCGRQTWSPKSRGSWSSVPSS